MSPSKTHDEQITRGAAGGEPAETRRRALARGEHVHRLLQSLPDIPPERRADAAQRYLAREVHKLDAEQRADIEAHVRRVLEDARFGELFAPGSRAELPIVGRISYADGRSLLVSGQIDRLAITDDVVLIADYKTNHPRPREVPDAYVAQLALYRAVLSRIYPGKAVRAALIWTDVPELVEISPSALDAELARLAGS
jgi:ATP-dependent helicase/nuclease subunit A